MHSLRHWINVINEAIVPQDMLAPRYFHGCRDHYDAQQILHYGLLPPDFAADGRTQNDSLRPAEGRVYMTPDARHAAIYGKYIFVFYRENLVNDLLPDEDEVGDVYHWVKHKDFHNVEREREIHKDSPEHLSRMEKLRDPANREMLYRFIHFMERTLTPKQIRDVLDGDYASWARTGKKAIKTMPPDIVNWLIGIGVHVSHQGPIKPDEAWELFDFKKLAHDGSNLAEVAKPFARDASIAPHDRTAPVYEYEVEMAFEYPPGSKTKTKTMKFRGISEQDAKRVAEKFIRGNTQPQANWRVVAIRQLGSEPVYRPAPTR